MRSRASSSTSKNSGPAHRGFLALKVLFATFSQRIPYQRGRSGSPIVLWGLIHLLLELKYEVTVVVIGHEGCAENDEQALVELREKGVRVLTPALLPLVAESPAVDAALLHRWSRLLPTVKWAPTLAPIVAETAPDLIYCYDLSGLAPFAALRGAPPLAASIITLKYDAYLVTERLTHLFRKSRIAQWKMKWKIWRSSRGLKTMTFEVLAHCALVVQHAAYLIDDIKAAGVARVMYLPNPVFDRVGEQWEEIRRKYQDADSRGKILFIGNLGSTVNQPALHLLADEIVPALAREEGLDFHLDIVGPGRPEESLARKLAHPRVRLRGFIPEPIPEYASAEVVLVPTAEKVGFRTRIVEGFSYGCAVVSHSSNLVGMRELADGHNVLLGDTGAELAAHCVALLRDPARRAELGRNARRTFEEQLCLPRLAARLSEVIEASVAPTPALHA